MHAAGSTDTSVEYVLFVSPSTLQIKILQGIARETNFRGNGTDSLGMSA